MDAVVTLAIVGGVAAFIGFIIWAAKTAQKQTLANVAALAARQGLQLLQEKKAFGVIEPRAEGSQGGRRVRFWAFATGSGKSRQMWIAAGVEPRRSGGFTFRLEAQGFSTKVAEFFGAKEITVGDAPFDAAWFVRSNAPELLAAALVPEIRAKLMAMHAAGVRQPVKLEQGWVTYAETGLFTDVKKIARLEAMLPVLHDLADVAEVCAGGDGR